MMRNFLLVAVLICCAAVPAAAQRRATGGGSATFAIAVTDPDGKPIREVLVTLTGGAARSVRTEGGRIALENLPPGNYRLRFEREGFVTLERELAARGGAPIDVKVTLTPVPPPPAPPPAPEPVKPAEPVRPTINAQPAVIDVPALIEKNWIGRSKSKTVPMTCGSDGMTQLIQLNEALMPHDHADTDESIYVVAGEGTAMVGDVSHRLKAGVFVFVPRATRHGLAPTGKNPLIVLSTRPGERCQ
jgi:mannose-6-phosphate isomerase-like protein (cupin superfamily)